MSTADKEMNTEVIFAVMNTPQAGVKKIQKIEIEQNPNDYIPIGATGQFSIIN